MVGTNRQVKLPNTMNCGLIFEPTLASGGSFISADCTDATDTSECTDAVTASTVSTMELYIYKPNVLASAATSYLTHGTVHVLGGSNAGGITVSQLSPGMKAEISGISNSGTVTVNDALDCFIADTVNSGTVSVSGSTAVLVRASTPMHL